MYKDKTICVVIPAHNESRQIVGVIESMPAFVDSMVVIDDASTDDTVMRVRALQSGRSHLTLIEHESNQGVGGAIASGYVWARDHHYDVAVVMAGDGQMRPEDLTAILDPVVSGRADFSKADRLSFPGAFKRMPVMRYLGNRILTYLTRVASGLWDISDSQSGYTAMNSQVLSAINWNQMYKRYGQPIDLLVRLSAYQFRVCDVVTSPVYHVGEQSELRIHRVILPISFLLCRMFIWRISKMYCSRKC